MKTVTVTALRKDIFRLIDQVLATGEPIVVRRKGGRIVLRGEPENDSETEEARAERWRRFWTEPPDIVEDLSFEDIESALKAYWQNSPSSPDLD